ncbi:MAG: zinc ribbon domain-containing protein [Verrucomicrobiota bacterium]
MPTYIYETIPLDESEEPECFEHYQSIHAEPLTRHPETGERVRRVITGGIFISKKSGLSTGKCCQGPGGCRDC